MGLKKYPDQMDHWSTDETYFDHKISSIMPKDSYKALKMAFHIDDDKKFPNDPFSKIRSFINYINEKFSYFYTPSQCVTIDESMIPFRGASSLVYYIPSKPHKFGIKMHEICESKSGYCYKFKLDGKEGKKIPDFTTQIINRPRKSRLHCFHG